MTVPENGPEDGPLVPDTSERAHAGLSPFCAHLGSKKLMLAQRPPTVDADVLDASNHCWCEITHQIIGPDGCAAHPEDCRKDRTCFESPLEKLL